MGERRPLVDGLKTKPEVEPGVEQQFVYQTNGKAQFPAPAAAAVSVENLPGKPTLSVSRMPFTTRVRADIAQALKRASLERQLQGIEPNTVQDILEAALEPWLKANGYLS
ncbi:MAG TPA: hypothetical protein VEL76_23345 [Gemmataceae bacterium]|nr:hypothetical protein [Gemmataceae bacterium]